MGQTTMSFRVDNALKRNFDQLCDDFGVSSSAAFTIFMKAVVRERKIPFEIKAASEEEIRHNALAAFQRMRADAEAAGIQDMPLSDINSIIREARHGQ